MAKLNWDDPVQVLEQVMGNESLLIELEKLRKKFVAAETEEKKGMQKRGYVIEAEQKEELLQEVKRVDPVLYGNVKDYTRKPQFVKAIDKRINDFNKDIDKAEERLRNIVLRERETTKKGSKVVEDVLKDMLALRKLVGRAVKNIEESADIESKIKQAIQEGTLSLENIDEYIRMANRLTKIIPKDEADVLVQMKALVEKMRKLKDIAQPIEKELEDEEDEAEEVRKKVKK